MAGGIPVLRFGPFDLDPASGRLFRGPERIPLPDPQVAALQHLVSHAGEVVSNDSLMNAVWGNVAVNDTSLRQVIHRLRQALGCGRNGTIYIETLRGRGTRFVALVVRAERDAPPASLEGYMAPHRALLQGRAGIDTLDPRRIPLARHDLKDSLRLKPDYVDALAELAIACGLEYEATTVDAQPNTAVLLEGIAYARAACARAPLSAGAWSALGYVLRLNGDLQAADAVCRAAALGSENPRILLLLGRTSWGGERLRLAARLLALFPDLALGHWLRASVFIARGALVPAADEVRLGCAAQDAQPTGAPLPGLGLHQLDGLILASYGRLEDAVAALMRELAYEHSGQLYWRECRANTLYALGAIRWRQNMPAESKAAFAAALKIWPGHVPSTAALRGEVLSSAGVVQAGFGRAIVLVLENRHEEAARVYLDAVAQAPPGPAGWLLPVEPMINVSARPPIWAETLALVRLRAT